MIMEKERLKYTIGRFDHLYDIVTNKSNIALGFGTVIFGVLLAVYPSLTKVVNFTLWLHINLAVLVALGFVSVIILIIASIPHQTPDSESVFYFRSISKLGEASFSKKSKELSDVDEMIDLRNQTYFLAKGLTAKFIKLRVALILIGTQFLLLIPYIIQILLNLK